MKRSDIYSLILIAGIGTFAAFLACNAILGDPNEAKIEYKTVSKVLTNELAVPNEEVFNDTAINPTIEVYVGDCEDIDQNGMLDMAELAVCGRVEASTVNSETTEEDLKRLRDGDYCITVEVSEGKKKTLCQSEKVEYIDDLLGKRDDGDEE